MSDSSADDLARRAAVGMLRVKSLHVPRERDVDGYTLRWCKECQQNYPCPTIQAIETP